jgi:nifR3 family TIM-barrel protein
MPGDSPYYGDPVKFMTDAKVVLAPMAGITDAAFRVTARMNGARFAFTEMIDANGMFYKNIKTYEMLDHPPEDWPLGVQIAGFEERHIIYAAQKCEERGYKMLDFNAACPVPKVVKTGKGAAFLRDVDRFASVMAKLVRAVSIPVTVKIRAGWDSDSLNYLEIARAAEGAGAKAVFIHARTKTAMYKGKPDHALTRNLKEAVGIPVFASGNIFSAGDAVSVLKDTGCDGVLIARGSLGNPWIFREFYDTLEGRPVQPVGFSAVKAALREHFELALRYVDEKRVFPRMYKHVAWYLKRYGNMRSTMKEYLNARDMDKFRAFMDRLEIDEDNRLYLKEGA